MADYVKGILISLVKSYYNRKDGSSRRVSIKPEKLYPDYRECRGKTGHLDEIRQVNAAADECRRLGFVEYGTIQGISEISKITLVEERIDDVERYLEGHYGYTTMHGRISGTKRLIAGYGGTPAADLVISELQEKLDKNRPPEETELGQLEDCLRALRFIETNEKDLFLREASMEIFGTSKSLEGPILHEVCKRLRAVQADKTQGNSEKMDEILEKYHIRRGTPQIRIKGDITLCTDTGELYVGILPSGISLSCDDIHCIKEIHVGSGVFMTVENETSYNTMQPKGAALMYSGGFIDRAQRDFLRKTYEGNHGTEYLHFGDIDAGGLRIHDSLCETTGIPFKTWHMSVEDLKNPDYEPCLCSLTNEDRKRLKALLDKGKYMDLIPYMLEHNVKLEQEIISLHNKCRHGIAVDAQTA